MLKSECDENNIQGLYGEINEIRGAWLTRVWADFEIHFLKSELNGKRKKKKFDDYPCVKNLVVYFC